MKTLKNQIRLLFVEAFEVAFPGVSVRVDVTRSTKAEFGHYQCNSAMSLAKPLKMAPRKISEVLVETLEKQSLGHPRDFIKKLEIAGPGFINIWVDESFLSKECNRMQENALLIELEDKPQRIIVDFSSPNIAKEMHVGHLRSTIIGDSICRMFEYMGHDVLRLNHIGDWGTSFGMLIAYLKLEVGLPKFEKEKVSLGDLVGWYKASKQKFDEDASFKKISQQEVVKLQGGDQENLALWQMICTISERAYRTIYQCLDVKILDRGESFYNQTLPDVVMALEEQGMVEVSDGAKCVFPEGYTNRDGERLPFMIQKSDGGYNYATTDLAAIRQRANEEHGERLIYVTDGGQATHFAMLFDVAKKAKFYDSARTTCEHVPFGLVLGPDGKKFKTRSGETEKLIDLLNTAVDKAEAMLRLRMTDRDESLSDDELKDLAQVMGIGAVKYADLSCNRTNDYMFSYERMLKFEGNTAAFLLYSYVRIFGIKRKIKNSENLLTQSKIELKEPSEIHLGLHLCQWFETLESVSVDLMPNRLSDYLYELAEKFNAFFRDCRVEGISEQNERLKLCDLTAQVLAKGLSILGLKTTERM